MAIEMLAMVPALLMLILANYTEKRKDLRPVTQAFLLIIIFLVILEGFLTLLIGGAIPGFKNLDIRGYGIILTGYVAVFFFLRPVRKYLSRFIDIDPDNWLHATAVVFTVLLIGMSLSTAAVIEDVVEIGQEAGISKSSVVLTQTFFAVMAIFGVGWLIKRDFKQTLKRLGLVKPSLRDLGMSVFFLLLLFAILVAVGIMYTLADPDVDYFDVREDPTVQLLGGVTILSAIILALSAGIGEELLFRGAMLPRLGLVLSALAFTVLHLQYPDPITLTVLFGFGLVFGHERRMVNTTACIITHASYDMILFFMAIA